MSHAAVGDPEPASIVRGHTDGLQSFDIFDTVLTRLVGQPTNVFLLAGERARRAGHWPYSAERFHAARMTAESNARAHAHPHEVSLRRIYAELRFACGITSEDAAGCSDIEVEVEGQLLRVVPAARLAVSDARRSGSEIAFISDMYLPASTIRAWLEREDMLSAGDAVWVSSESLATKASGSLFTRLLTHPGGAQRWKHVGDHAHADVAVPRSLGIEATHWNVCALTRYESEMERHALASGALSSLLAGAARWLRLSHPAVDDSQATLRDLAAGVAGPVLWAFVTWVLLTAAREGLSKVWFTARDGQVLLRMARRIAPRLGIDIPMGYLYGGRQVVHLAGLRQIDERALKWLTGAAGALPAAALLERAGLVPDQVRDALRRHGIPLDGPIGWERVAALEGFYRDPEVEHLVLAAAATRRKDMRDYFSACGLVDGRSCAVIDIGWRGSVLRSMFDILGAGNGARHHFLYFGLYGRPSDAPEARMSAFCFDLGGTDRLGSSHDVPSLMAVMETFCQADHAQVVHVERRGGDFVPLLRRPPIAHPTRWDVAYFQDCLEAFADTVRVDLAIDADADLRPLCERLLRMLMETPGLAEAAVLGSVQYVDDQSGTTAQPFAHAYGFADARELARTGVLPAKTLAWWWQGAWALTPPATQLWLRVARRVGRWRKRTRSASGVGQVS